MDKILYMCTSGTILIAAVIFILSSGTKTVSCGFMDICFNTSASANFYPGSKAGDPFSRASGAIP